MTTKLIVNPYSGRWKAQAAIPAVEQACQAAGLDYDLVVTDKPGHGIDLEHFDDRGARPQAPGRKPP